MPDGDEGERFAISRRRLIGGAIVGAASVVTGTLPGPLGTRPAAAATLGVETGVVRWSMLEKGKVIATFAELTTLTLDTTTPTLDELFATPVDQRLPIAMKPPLALLRNSPNVKRLRAWRLDAINLGPGNVTKTVVLAGRNSAGVVTQRFRLTNAFPAKLSLNRLETSDIGTNVDAVLFACTRVEIL